MKRALRKITYREIRRSMGRFLAIMLIVMLGAGFLAGLTVAQISEFSIVFVAMGITLGHVGVDLAAEIAPAGKPAGFSGSAGPGEPVPDQPALGAACADQDLQQRRGLFGGVDRPAVAVAQIDDGAHQARPAVLADVMPGVDLAGMGRTALAANRSAPYFLCS